MRHERLEFSIYEVLERTIFLALDEPHHKLLDGVGKLGIRLEAPLEALVVVLLRALADGGHGGEGVEGNTLVRVETRLVVALLDSGDDGHGIDKRLVALLAQPRSVAIAQTSLSEEAPAADLATVLKRRSHGDHEVNGDFGGRPEVDDTELGHFLSSTQTAFHRARVTGGKTVVISSNEGIGMRRVAIRIPGRLRRSKTGLRRCKTGISC
jgi:hypothetical protein